MGSMMRQKTVHAAAPSIARGGGPLVSLVGAQRLAVELAARKGVDPDRPRALSRSVILE
jgi:glucosamine 6-phosphate synthetase-like amidotransferase/phosphosugar isomerase protein